MMLAYLVGLLESVLLDFEEDELLDDAALIVHRHDVFPILDVAEGISC